jgi:2-(1,2-epoxy-1,2-dihydrophenyl)acetyl-CoA isomerase
MNYKYILLDIEDGIATITFNRPEKLNSLFPDMRVEIRHALDLLSVDDTVRVVILTGAGRGFCAGADVTKVMSNQEMADDEPRRALLLKPVATSRLLSCIRDLPKPTICAINGVIAGSGMCIALSCDIIIASDQTSYRLAFTRMGMPPRDGLSYLLPRRIGTHRALELAYTNRLVTAQEMERMGFVNKIVPHDELLKAANEMAKSMLHIPPITLALAKQCIYQGVGNASDEDKMAFSNFAVKTIEETEDYQEAQKSFVEKRSPKYQGK